MVESFGALVAITLTMLLASTHGSVRRQPEIDLRFERLGKLGQLDRGPGVQPDLVSHKNRCL